MGERMTTKEAAEKLGITEQLLRICIQQDKYPFAFCVKQSSVFTYVINRTQFEQYLGGK